VALKHWSQRPVRRPPAVAKRGSKQYLLLRNVTFFKTTSLIELRIAKGSKSDLPGRWGVHSGAVAVEAEKLEGIKTVEAVAVQ
jgi:hypothetical protein